MKKEYREKIKNGVNDVLLKFNFKENTKIADIKNGIASKELEKSKEVLEIIRVMGILTIA